MLQQQGEFSGSRAKYVRSDAASRSVYRPPYVPPRTSYSYRLQVVRPVVPAGRGPGGASLLAAILGPIGGLTGCLCCLNTLAIWSLFITAIFLIAALGPVSGLAACACCLLIAGVWGLFATTIALAIYARDWTNAIRDANGLNHGTVEMIFSGTLLVGILCVHGYLGIRRVIRSTD